MTPQRDRALAAAREALRAALVLLEQVDVGSNDGPDWVDVAEHVPLPRRLALAAARAGAISGAVKKGRTWVARREAVDAWLTNAEQPDESGSLCERWAEGGR